MKKILVVLFIFLILLFPSIIANSLTIDNGFFVKIKSSGIKEIDSQNNLVDRIFDDMKEKMRSANTQDDYKIVFKETLFELEKYDLLGDVSAIEVYKMINRSYDEGETYSIYGEVIGHTHFLKLTGVFFYELHKKYYPFFSLMYNLLRFIDFEFRNTIVHAGSYIIFGSLISLRYYVYGFNPAQGYIKINSSNEQTEYNGYFYGHSEFMIEQNNPNDPEVHIIYCIGIKDFKGILINGHYFGTAKDVNIGAEVPDPFK